MNSVRRMTIFMLFCGLDWLVFFRHLFQISNMKLHRCAVAHLGGQAFLSDKKWVSMIRIAALYSPLQCKSLIGSHQSLCCVNSSKLSHLLQIFIDSLLNNGLIVDLLVGESFWCNACSLISRLSLYGLWACVCPSIVSWSHLPCQG